jgi:hypothetical protein
MAVAMRGMTLRVFADFIARPENVDTLYELVCKPAVSAD